MTALDRLDAGCDDLPGFKGQRLRAWDWASNRGRTFTPNIAAAGVRLRGPAGPANHPAYAFDVHRNSPALLRARTPPACNDAASQGPGWVDQPDPADPPAARARDGQLKRFCAPDRHERGACYRRCEAPRRLGRLAGVLDPPATSGCPCRLRRAPSGTRDFVPEGRAIITLTAPRAFAAETAAWPA